MNTLARMCPVEDILLDAKVQNRHQLFEYVARHLQRRYGLAAKPIIGSLEARERMGSTALGQGVAIPHARLSDLSAPLAVFIRPELPIAFDAPDGKPVGELILLLVPQHASQDHLQILADAARLFCERSFRALLRAAATPFDVRRILLESQAS
ncbi:PTS IIA-like nitrogen-regulatory protein PtsN [Chitinimonas prasina]|uniref:PTS IIA-like nitrogen-regulatory protein PtsN n=1 Tax=Chitinimonas prasina TaxID=1434937 RepID=A0ABQ5YFE6_9NEIS|nr:PTS sugar transporter subunit IIA [Chitinimonas prasina]GLR13449.1 PTS IIA-like nitrogen-regulatory protein PtsN [Chitinimonas prasina]